MVNVRDVKEGSWGKVVAVLFCLNLLVLVLSSLNLKHPYRKVELVEAYILGDYLYTTHTFIKGSCTRKRFSVSAYQDGLGTFLTWEGLDGVPEDYNREEGVQTLRGRMNIKGLDPDEVLYRTLHDCEGDNEPPYTQKVFDRIKAEDIQKRDSGSPDDLLGLRSSEL